MHIVIHVVIITLIKLMHELGFEKYVLIFHLFSWQAPSTKNSIAGASANFSNYLANKNKSPQKKTTAITVTKGQKRKAHNPTVVRSTIHAYAAVKIKFQLEKLIYFCL